MLDAESFQSLFAESYQHCWLIAAAITGDRVEADDIVQESSLIAFAKRAEFKAGTSFTAWISQIVRLTALNYLRKSVRRTNIATDPAMIDRAVASVAVSAKSGFAAISESGRLNEDHGDFDDEVLLALHEISDEARACLLLRVVQQLSYGEISQTLQIPEGTAMSHVHRAKQSMRRRLKHHQSSSLNGLKNQEQG